MLQVEAVTVCSYQGWNTNIKDGREERKRTCLVDNVTEPLYSSNLNLGNIQTYCFKNARMQTLGT